MYDSRQGRFCQPIMEERKFECENKVFIEKVVRECTCLPKRTVEVRGRVIERTGSIGMYTRLINSSNMVKSDNFGHQVNSDIHL